MRNAQSGSIFIWIFVMIALFGALSYAMLQGSRGGAGTLTTEQNRLAAQEMIQFGTKVREAVHGLRIDGCKESELSFENSDLDGDYSNPYSPTDNHCHIFDAAGAKLSIPQFTDGRGDDRVFFGSNIVESESGTRQLGTANEDLTMIREVSRDTCGEINSLLKNPTDSWVADSGNTYRMWESAGAHNGARNPSTDAWAEHIPFQGDYWASGGRGIRFRTDMLYNGQDYGNELPPLAGCFCDSTNQCDPPAKFYYYQVLIAR